MRKIYLLLLLVVFLQVFNTVAQTTISTPAPAAFTFLSGSSGITFVIQNTNTYPVILTDVAMWRNTASSVATYKLWYSSTSLSGTSVVQPTAWTQISQVTPSTITTSAVYPIFTGLSFIIPASTTYRFCVQSSNRVDYSTAANSSGNTFSAAGINLRRGDFTIGSAVVGYAGSGTNVSLANSSRFFHGSVTFAPACDVPTGVAVSNITANSATVNWTAIPASQGYEYVLDQNSANPSGSGTPHATTTLPLSGLTQNTNYYIHVRNKCSSTSFSDWVNIPFTTLTTCFPPNTVTVSNLTATTGTLFWTPVAGSAGYDYKIDQNASDPISGWNSATANTQQFSGLTGGASYFAHVRNLCPGGDKSSWVHMSFTMPQCNTPTNIIISNVTDSAAHALWSQMPGTGNYDYAVSFDKTPPVTGIMSTTSIAANLNGLVPNSKYYFHLRSRCFGIDSSEWLIDSFITKMPCYAPIVQVNNLGTNTPYVFWDPVPTAVAYEYTLTNTATMPAFGKDIYTTYVNVTLDDDGKDYYMHVRAQCNSMYTYSPWSVVALRTSVTKISAPGQTGSIEIYPNPVNENLYIRNATPGTAYMINDMTGRVLGRGVVSLDKPVNVQHLSPGLYILELSTDDGSQNVRFIKQ